MNRNYKVVWNRSLGCFTAVAEYAKSRGKPSSGSVSSNSGASAAIASGAKLLRLTAICAGIAASGFSMQASADFSIQANAEAAEVISDGETVTFQDGNSNIKITRTGNTISIATSLNPNFTTVTTTGNSTVGGNQTVAGTSSITGTQTIGGMLNANGGLTVGGGKTVSMGSNRVTNVADGTATKDAVNFGQLDAVRSTATNANQGWNIQANGGTAQTIAPGATVNFTNGDNIAITRNGNTISIATSLNPNFTTVTTTGNSTVGGNQTVAGTSSITGTQTIGGMLNANGGLTVASGKTVNMGGNKVTNVADGNVVVNGKDAATTGQLWKLTEGGDGVKYFHAKSAEADSKAIGQESIAIGPKTKAEGNSSLAAGDSASVTAQGAGAIALGQNATAGGATPNSGGAGAVAVGRNSKASGSSATALGDGAQASGENATALGKSANASGSGAIALSQANARGSNSFAAGNGAVTNTRDSIALGRNAGVGTGTEINDSGQRHSFIAIGELAGQNIDGNQAIAIGVGAGSNTKQSNQVAIGTEAGTYLEGERNVSIGFETNKKTTNTAVRHATAIGSLSVADTDAVAVGYEAKATSQSVAIGAGATADSGSIALGHNSAAVQVTGASYLTAKAFTGESVSVGNAATGFKRRITNVEDGAAESDAVNVNQLKALKDSLGSFSPGSGGNVNYNADGTISVADANQAGQAVSLSQLNQAVANGKPKFYSVNPVGDSANENGSGALGADSANSMAIGHAASISRAQRATAVGYSVIVRADDGTAIGSGSTVDNTAGVAIGKGAYSRGNNSLAMGTDAQTEPKDINSTSRNAIAIGTSSRATDNSASALGNLAVASGLQSSALGYFAQAKNTDSMAFGSNSVATGVSSQANGTNARASGTNAQARGTDARASGTNAQASGTNANASGLNAVAQGTRATGYATDGIAVGTGATSGFDDLNNQDPERNTAGIAIGKNSLADQKNALALGVEAKARAKSATALGDSASATDVSAIAIGSGAAASKQDTTAIGSNAAASAQDATAFGRNAAANAQDAIAFGRGSIASEQRAIALGQGAKANTNANDVALGAGSITGAVVNTPNATIDKNVYSYAGTNASSTVSVGTAGNERTVTNVAAGRVLANSTDAINGSQLFGTNQAVNALANNLDTAGQSVASSLGGNSAYNATTHQVTPSLNVNGNTYTNVQNAVQYAAQGWGVKVNASAADTVLPGETVQFVDGKNIKVTRDSDQVIRISTGDDVEFTKVTLGNATNNTVVTSGANGLDVGGDKITNVAAGTTPTDAVNFGQLTTTNNNVTTNAGNITTLQGGFTLQSNGTNSGAIKAGDTVDIGTATGETNITVAKNGNVVDFALNKDLNLSNTGSVTVGNSLLNTNGLTITNGPSITVTNGINAGSKQITGVASGIGNDTNAANIGDLKNAVTGVTNAGLNFKGDRGTAINRKLGDTLNITGGAATGAALTTGNIGIRNDGSEGLIVELARNIDLGTDGSVKTGASLLNNNGLTITGGPSITTSGINAGNKAITGVLAGVAGTDAVNVNQLSAANNANAAARTIVAAGTNVATVTEATNGTTGQKTYTVNANGAKTVAGSAALTVAETALAGNVTQASVDLSAATKASLVKADNAVLYDTATKDRVTLGTAGTPVTITNVAAGTTPTDAVNFGQLTTTNNNVTTNAGNITTLQGGFTLQSNGANGAAIRAGDTVDVGTADGETNITVAKNGNVVDFALSKNLDLSNTGSVTVGGNVFNSSGLTIAGGPSVTATNGINAGNKQITGVASGVGNDNNAANIGDLKNAVTGATNAGLNFQGDRGLAVNRKLGETLNITGGAAAGAILTAGNIGIRNDGSNGLVVELAQKLDLGTDGSVKTGASLLNNTGLTITGGPSVTSTGINAGNKVITGVANGSVAAGSKEAINGGQLNTEITTLTNNGFKIAADKGTTDTVKLNETVTYASSDGSIITTVTDNNINFALGDDLSVGTVGPSGTNGFIGVNGKDGLSGVAINGANGSIGLTGPSGVNGTISVKNGAPGLNGATGPRLDLDGKEIATLQDGLKFAGNSGTTIAKTLNQTLNIEGGLANTATASGANLRVDSDGNKLNLVMARDLTQLDSVTTGNSTLNTNGLTITGGPSVTATNGINAGNKQITGVASGVGNDNNAANIGDLKNAVTGATNAGLNFQGDRGLAVNRKLGETLNITGGAAAGAILTAGNIGIRNDGSNGLVVELAQKLDLGTDGSVKTGASLLDNTGLTITGGPKFTSAGISAGGQQIKDVANGNIGPNSQQAINGRQLFNTGTSIANNLGGGSVVNTDGTISAPSYVLNNGNNDTGTTTFNNVGSALGNLDGRTTTNTADIAKGINFGDGTTNNNYKLGDVINVKGDSNISSTTTTDGVQLALANVVNVGTTNPVTINGNTGTISGLTNTTYDPNATYTGGQAATQEQLSGLNGTLTNIGFNISADNGNDDRVKLGQTVNFTNDDGNLVSTVRDNEIVYDLADDITVKSVTIGDGVNDTKLTTNTKGLSVNQSKIVDILDGDVTSTSQQAINGRQLFGTANSIKNAIGGETVVNPNGTITTTNIGNTGKNNINDAIEAVGTAAAQAKSTVSGSSNVNIVKTGPANGPNDYQVVIKDDISLNQVTTGNTVTNNDGVTVNDKAGNSSTMTTAGTTVTNAGGDTSSYGAGGMVAGNTTDGKSTIVNQDGISFTGADGKATGPSITAGGINAGNTIISGVADGVLDSDAANIGQLNKIEAQANKGFNVTTAQTGTGTVSGITVSQVAPGATQTITAGNNISITQNGIDLTIATNPNLIADSLTTGNTKVSDDGLSFTDDDGNATGPMINATGINAGNTVITGVTAGALNSTSTDAVNGSQLNATNNNVTNNTNAIGNNTANINKGINFGDGSTANNYALGNTISVTGDKNVTTTTVAGGVQVGLNKDIDLGSEGSVTTGNTTVNNNGVTIKDGPSITTGGINAGGKVVTGVADGIKVTDAANVGQLNVVENRLIGAVNDLGYRIDDVADDANAGISAAMAMSSIPQSFMPGKSMIGGGISSYNGEGAVAVGLSKVSDNGRWVMKINGTADTQGNAGGAIGAGFHF